MNDIVTVELHSRAVPPQKAVVTPDIGERTVQTNSPGTYVALRLKRQHANRALLYWEQAQEFRKVAQGLPPHSAPLLLYYSFLNATKALLMRFYQREASGQLFARVRGDDWEIVTATEPPSRDRRGRFSFWPHRASEQKEIFEHHALGLDYVGDWHTHPEDAPTPSSDDLTSIAEVVRRSTHHLPGFLLLIVGRKPFPAGLWGSFHPTSGVSKPAENMRLSNGHGGLIVNAVPPKHGSLRRKR